VASRQAGEDTQAAIVRDVSASPRNGCETVAALAAEVTRLGGLGSESILTLFTTGDRTNAYAAKLIKAFPIPFSKKVMEGQKAIGRRRAEFVDLVKSSCDSLPKTDVSPILAAVKDAVAQMRKTCGTNASCVIFVQTDGDETIDPNLRAALRGSASAMERVKDSIDNAGVKIAFCGFSQTQAILPKAASRRAPFERMEKVWTSVFTDASNVSATPYCPNQ
jgi:hypothetical protein